MAWGTEGMTFGATVEGGRKVLPGLSLQWDITEPWLAGPGFSQGLGTICTISLIIAGL